MPTFRPHDRVELLAAFAGLRRGSSGTVRRVYRNGNLHLRITHAPGCKPRPRPVTILSIPDELVGPSDCPEA